MRTGRPYGTSMLFTSKTATDGTSPAIGFASTRRHFGRYVDLIRFGVGPKRNIGCGGCGFGDLGVGKVFADNGFSAEANSIRATNSETALAHIFGSMPFRDRRDFTCVVLPRDLRDGGVSVRVCLLLGSDRMGCAAPVAPSAGKRFRNNGGCACGVAIGGAKVAVRGTGVIP